MSENEFEDDDVIAEIKITIHRNGAMAVRGAITDEKYALACLDAAKDSIKNHHARQRLHSGLIIPNYDSPLR